MPARATAGMLLIHCIGNAVDAVMDEIAVWLDRHNVSLMSLLITVALLIGAPVAIFMLKRLLQGWLQPIESRLHWRYETALTITRLVTGALWVIVVMLVLEIWGISFGGFWTLLVSAATV